jgi:hypothetical protein
MHHSDYALGNKDFVSSRSRTKTIQGFKLRRETHMKRIAFILVVAVFCLGVPGSMLAQANANVGTWKLNLEKSKYPAGTAPKSLTRTVAVDGDSVKYSFEGQGPDGAALSYGFTAKYDGKDYEISGSGMPYGADHISIKKLNSHQFSAVLKKGDKVVANNTTTISHDGKTATLNSKGADAKGKPVKSTAIYDKQ